MIVVLPILLTLAWFEEEVTRGHFENHARERP